MENKKVWIENRAFARVGFTVPELRFTRVWEKKGVKKTVDLDILKEGFYSPGNEYLFKNDILYIIDKDVRIELGLEEPESEGKEQTHIELDEKQMRRYLTVVPLQEFKEFISKLTNGQKQMLVDFAVNNDLITLDRNEIIKQFTHKDIMKIIQLKKAAEEK